MAKKASSAKSVVKKAPASRAVAKPIKKVLAKPRKVQAPPRQEEAEEQLKPIKLKCPLSRKELGEYRSLLIEKRRTLMGDMDGMHAEAMRDNRDQGSSDLSTMPVHMADIGTDNYEQEFTLGLLESERQLLREIDEALQRIVDGTYGVCLGTGKPINKSRLRAMPWAKYSIEYARLMEQGRVAQAQKENAALFDEEGEPEEEQEEAEVEQPEVMEESYEPEEDDLGADQPGHPLSAAAQEPAAGRTASAWIVFILVFAAGLALDLWSKHAVFNWLIETEPSTGQRQIIPHILRFKLSTNPGIVFGLHLLPWLVVLASLAAIVVVLYFFITSPRRSSMLHVALGMILAGALGNLYDRLFTDVRVPGSPFTARHEVRDFIDLSQVHYKWIFNVADMLLVIGVLLLLLASLVQWRKEQKAARPTQG